MKSKTYIGDVHGKISKYKEIVSGIDGDSVQIGDFGFKHDHDWFLENIDYSRHKILFGNHDYHPMKERAHSMGRWKVEGRRLYVSGAYSIDKYHRLEGFDWFADEELRIIEFYDMFTEVKDLDIDVVISHDCPQVIREDVFLIKDRSRTSDALQALYEELKPFMWIFGHHHLSITYPHDSTEFRCLAELEVFKV